MTPRVYSYIRFSAPEQEKGDSHRRQLQQAEEWARDHDMVLDNTLRMTDRGLSGYHGTHKTKGTLGEFLNKVNTGKIARGSVLLIENMDRLSREKPMTALRQFDEIIRAGIKVVTLQTGTEYTEESINKNSGQLYIIIGEIQRANSESERKSYMLKKAWEEKRKNAANGTKLTKKVPAWIDPISNETIPLRVHTIKLIFKMKLAGMHAEKIAKELNQIPKGEIWVPEKNEHSKRKIRKKIVGWRSSYINKILTNRAVIGEFQPHKTTVNENGKRVRIPAGDPIPNYFKKVIDDDIFYATQQYLKERGKINGNAGGRTGKANNIFTHTAKCGLCGGALHFIDKGSGSKGGQYLHCDNAKRNNIDCPAKAIKYDEFLKVFFDNFPEINIDKIIPDPKETTKKIIKLEQYIKSNIAKINTLDRQIANLIDTISKIPTESERTEYKDTVKNLKHKKQEHISDNKEFTDRISKLEDLQTKVREKHNAINRYYKLLNEAKDEQEQINLRIQFRSLIQSTFDVIKVFPLLDNKDAIEYYKREIQRVKAELDERKKKDGEKTKRIPKGAVLLSSLRRKLKELQEDNKEPGIEIKMDSKSIDRIDLYFSGVGIIEKDEDGETRIKHRAVRMKRRVLTEEFYIKRKL